ncbi:hypothetical protein D8B34_23245 [Verminephrobacter eiseniae]|nr:hypothetical protein [Verminephrobacter eiseniae]MCW5230923.1 hypothetical protein [Verminephrobacter eiseniae]MCW5292656.1 hypothetical protein [Verminephrobacter eiseniae]MCW8187214.1 hypothetical protein [Verminephrobacter eiseniae]MCW8225613.1 hypothetical protein [Verminephrobacter eiseniae]MCW8236521.1 hypothetical protein [Verminephrobacter eiseniae]
MLYGAVAAVQLLHPLTGHPHPGGMRSRHGFGEVQAVDRPAHTCLVFQHRLALAPLALERLHPGLPLGPAHGDALLEALKPLLLIFLLGRDRFDRLLAGPDQRIARSGQERLAGPGEEDRFRLQPFSMDSTGVYSAYNFSASAQ